MTEWKTLNLQIGNKTLINSKWPAQFSETAAMIVASRYFFSWKDENVGEQHFSDLVSRVCETIAHWGLEDGYFQNDSEAKQFEQELSELIYQQKMAFNSPVWFNVGIWHKYKKSCDAEVWVCDEDGVRRVSDAYKNPQTSACFIVSVEDSLESIFDLVKNYAKIFKFGSGVGTNLSTIRASCEYLYSNYGKPSGPLSFMRVLDSTAQVVKSGGKTRRAAIMQVLNLDHPDIVDFIRVKADNEEKAREILSSTDISEVELPFQNANFSVRATDEFMEAVLNDQQFKTKWVTNSQINGPTYSARYLWKLIAECAWKCGDPGIQFDTTCQKYNTTPSLGRINASNPCSEVHLPDNSACNLASLNLVKFFKDGKFDIDSFLHAIRLTFLAQDIIIDRSSYPTEKIALHSHIIRPIGLGFTNLGSLLMLLGVPYDSDEARTICSCLCALMTAAAIDESVRIATIKGPFPVYPENKDAVQSVHGIYLDRASELVTQCKKLPGGLDRAAKLAFKLFNDNIDKPVRNSHFTSLAPTGTISLMMDAMTTGIEPAYALVSYKKLMDGSTITYTNDVYSDALRNLGYSDSEIQEIRKFIEENNSIVGAPHLNKKHYSIFSTALDLSWEGHLLMVAAAQKFITQGISKTINLPSTATMEDIERVYMRAWEEGLKCVSVYRDGSKVSQILYRSKDAGSMKERRRARRRRLPNVRESVTHKFNIGGHEGYIIVGLYEDKQPGEIFIVISKEGSQVRGLYDTIGTLTSLALQHGVPLKTLVEKFSYCRFEPCGYSGDPQIGFAHSIVDYIFRWLGNRFQVKTDQSISDILCQSCGSPMKRTGTCYTCTVCGQSNGGCS